MKLERIKRRNAGDLILEITPLIDVVFLLLIFFMVATTFNESTILKINLPKSAISKRVSVVKDIEILIDKNRNMYLNYKENSKTIKEKINNETFVSSLSKKLKESSKKEIIISADESIDYGYVVQIMGLSKEAGASAININTAIKK